MLLMAIAFVVLLLMNVPIAFTLGIAGLLYFLFPITMPLPVVVQRMIIGTQSFPLLAVPFFVLGGHLMNASGMTSRLVKLADAIAGRLPGSLAQVSTVLSILIGGVSGSSNADVAMESRILLPEMRRRGYDDGFSAAVLSCDSLCTAIIPPSICLVLYGYVAQVSIGKLLMAGLIPGILMGLSAMVVNHVKAVRRGYDLENRGRRKSFKGVLSCLKESIWALLFPVFLLITIRYGIFAPTEAAAFTAIYAVIVGFFIYRELTWAKIWQALKDAAEDTAIIMLILSMAAISMYVFASEMVPVKMANAILGLSENPVVLITAIMAILFVAGMFMEGTVNILLLTPIFLPIIIRAGFDPVHFGVMLCIMIQIGGITPPVGVNMYTVCSLGNIPVESCIKESLAYILAYLILLVILIAFPQITLALVGIMK